MSIVSTLAKYIDPIIRKAYSTVDMYGYGRGGWYSLIREPYTGAWQRNQEVDQNTALSYYAIFACITLIASDAAKLRLKLVELSSDGVWQETTNPAYTPVLRKPNSIQNRIQFWENYFISKLICGNAYVLKGKDNRGVVASMYVLNPYMVRPIISDDGQVFYRLKQDNIANIPSDTVVPSTEIIHDRWNCFFHPLVGLSPLYANSLAATQGIRIQQNSVSFFGNASNPGGILTTPSYIPQEQAMEMKDRWEENFSGNNLGRVAVLGNGLSFQNVSIAAVDAQLIEQGRWTGEIVCSTFHVPPYKVGIGPLPSYNNIQALNVEYYSQCLQVLLESAELCVDEGLGLGNNLGVEFDVDNLLRMDTLLQAETTAKLTSAGIMEINEGRKRFNLGGTIGGNAAYLQQQNYSLEALAKRDASDDPFGKGKTPSAESQDTTEDDTSTEQEDNAPTLNGKSILSNAVAARHLDRLMLNAARNT